MTKSEFINYAKLIHGSKFDYSSIKYIDSKTPIDLICPIHGKIRIKPITHLQKTGCGKCNINKSSHRLTTAEFIKRAKEKHGDKYDYSKTQYINWTSKVTIICPKHGEFTQRADRHMYHNGCPQCYFGPVETTSTFINKAISVHGNKYDYSKTFYKNARTKITITCKQHGDFEQMPSQHIRGQGCVKCGYIAMQSKLCNTTDEFIKKAQEIHGSKYDYSSTIYQTKKHKVTIICKIHGQFQQLAYEHLRGRGCKLCSATNRSYNKKQIKKPNNQQKLDHAKKQFIKWTKLNNYKQISEYINNITPITVECVLHGAFSVLPSQKSKCKCCKSDKADQDFISKAYNTHGNKYQYHLNDIDTSGAIKITCPKHGDFRQKRHVHLKHGCPKCTYDKLSQQRMTQKEYIDKANAANYSQYDYGQYNGLANDIDIICKKHGIFKANANQHLMGRRSCPKCAISRPQSELYTIIRKLYSGEVIQNDRHAISPYEIDIYLPSLSIGYELHGAFWHSFDNKESPSDRVKHSFKCDYALSNGIRLYQFFDHELYNKKRIITSMIANTLGASNVVYARKCKIIELQDDTYRELCNKCHIQGYRSAAIKLGLIYNDNIMCCMSFSKYKDGFEIIRFFNSLNTRTVGGASKLLAYFITHSQPSSIYTYADRRFSTGALYDKIGFTRLSTTKPNYTYMAPNGTILSRQKCQKHKLAKLLGTQFNQNATESTNMFLAGYRRIWDAGHNKFIMQLRNTSL